MYRAQVNEERVILLEVHVLSSDPDSTVKTGYDWFRGRHLQEIIQLVREIVLKKIEDVKKEKTNKTSAAGTYATSDIITGTCVRFGYMFKKRPCNQMCLSLDGNGLQSFTVSRDKLVVYACQVGGGSPRKSLSQLVKVLGDSHQTASQTVSISSYFKKVPSSQSSSQSSADVDSKQLLPPIPDSGGKRHAIKKILDRGSSALQKKKVRSSKEKPRTLKQQQHHVKSEEICTTDECQSDSAILHVETRQALGDRSPSKRNNSGSDSDVSVGEKEHDSIYQESNVIFKQEVDKPSQLAAEKLDSIVFDRAKERDSSPILDTVIIRQVENRCLSWSEDKGQGSVTVVSVDQVNEMLSTSNNTTSVASGSCDSLSHEQNMASCDQEGGQSDTDSIKSDHVLLPSASFVKTFNSRASIMIPQKPPKSNKNSGKDLRVGVFCDSSEDDVELMSPVFIKQKSQNSQMTIVNEGERSSSYKNEACPGLSANIDAEKKTIQRPRQPRPKRKLPDFDLPDEEESVSVKHIAKSRKYKENYNRDKMNIDTNEKRESDEATVKLKKPLEKQKFPKNFFSQSNEKKQSKLTFLSQSKSDLYERGKAGDQLEEESETIDCFLIEELSQMPQVKDERTEDLKREIRSLSDVSKLNDEQLRFLVLHSEDYLRKIFEGKVSCERHADYKKGGRSRLDLNYQVRFGLFVEEQQDIIMETLMSIFCRRHHKYLDYILKVILPEMMIKIYMELHGTSYHETEDLMIHGSNKR